MAARKHWARLLYSNQVSSYSAVITAALILAGERKRGRGNGALAGYVVFEQMFRQNVTANSRRSLVSALPSVLDIRAPKGEENGTILLRLKLTGCLRGQFRGAKQKVRRRQRKARNWNQPPCEPSAMRDSHWCRKSQVLLTSSDDMAH
jgi:hypothetical protein